MNAIDFQKVGGKLIQRGQPLGLMSAPNAVAAEDYWDFGWINPERREPHHQTAYAEAVAESTPFHIVGSTPQASKVDLTELWSHPSVVSALGFAYPGTWQLTGSCVGAGGGNVIFTLAAIEVLRLNDPEQIFLPWWLYTYGRSRFHLGDTGPGEGSLESTWGVAATKDGVINAALAGFPKPARITETGYCYDSSLEMRWSAGGRSPVTDQLTEGRSHLIRSMGILRDAGQVREALLNGYPVGQGSMYGYTSWVDNEGTSLGKRGPRWSHKMAFFGFWEHPKYGPLYKNVNQWDRGSTDSGKFNYVWVPEADVEWICRSGEVRCYSQFNGYPATTFSWGNF